MKCTLTKLGTHENAKFKVNPFGAFLNDPMCGEFTELPKIGNSFEIIDVITTSKIKSIYIKGNSQDKLVLPMEFPNVLDVDFSKVKLENGEMLLATNNSIYTLTSIE